MLWRPAATPSPQPAPEQRDFAIEHVMHQGDVTVLYSAGAEVDADSRLVHAHVVNTGDTPAITSLPRDLDDLSVDQISGASRQEVVPPHSIQHRVIRVPKKRANGSVLDNQDDHPGDEVKGIP